MNKISTRTAYGEALAEIGSDPRIFVLDADLQCCTRTEKFGALYPERSRNVGIAEANMVGIAAGMATCGKIVFVNSSTEEACSVAPWASACAPSET